MDNPRSHCNEGSCTQHSSVYCSKSLVLGAHPISIIVLPRALKPVHAASPGVGSSTSGGARPARLAISFQYL